MIRKLPDIRANNSLTHLYFWVDFIKKNHKKTKLLVDTYDQLGKDDIEKYPYDIDFFSDMNKEFQPFVVAAMISRKEFSLKKLFEIMLKDDNSKALNYYLDAYKNSLSFLDPIWIETYKNAPIIWKTLIYYLLFERFIGSKKWIYIVETYQKKLFHTIIMLNESFSKELFLWAIYHKVNIENDTLQDIMYYKEKNEQLYAILKEIIENGIVKNKILEYDVPVIFKNNVRTFRRKLLEDDSFMIMYKMY